MESKKIVISMMVVLVIIIILTSILLINLKGKQNDIAISNEIEDHPQNIPTIQKVIDKSKFYTVSNCISQYFSEMNKNNPKYYGMNEDGSYGKIVTEETIQKNILNLLSKEYIDQNKITTQSVYQFIDEIEETIIFIPIQMKVLEVSDIEKYIVYGYITNEKNDMLKTQLIGVNLDKNNRTFSIEPIRENNKKFEEIEITNKTYPIEEKENNQFNYINATNEYVVKEYLNAYKRIALANPQIAFNYLDQSYKEKRFGNVENYKQYIQKNRAKILATTISKYQVTKNGNITQYTCIMEDNEYYIFQETATMQFTLLLDTYTIDIPEYTQKYNQASEQQKVAFCIDKFVKNINAENYQLAYGMLASSFKNNYFQTQQQFEEYAKRNFLGKEKITFIQFKNEANLYNTYLVTLQEAKEEAKSIQKTFIVKLGTGTNFELSFNID